MRFRPERWRRWTKGSNTDGDGIPVVVYNPLGWERSGEVTVKFSFPVTRRNTTSGRRTGKLEIGGRDHRSQARQEHRTGRTYDSCAKSPGSGLQGCASHEQSSRSAVRQQLASQSRPRSIHRSENEHAARDGRQDDRLHHAACRNRTNVRVRSLRMRAATSFNSSKTRRRTTTRGTSIPARST